MDPKKLAALFAEKTAKVAAEQAQKKVIVAEQNTELSKRMADGQKALTNVVIPYLDKVKQEFPKGQFSFNPSARVDANDLTPVGVTFKIVGGPLLMIEVISGNVTISKSEVLGSPTNVKFVFSPDQEPFIKGPSDLTPAKLGKLIELTINEIK